MPSFTAPTSGLHLFHCPGTRSDRILWLLREIDSLDKVTLHKVDIFKGEHFQADFLSINAGARVPVLVDDGFVLAESAAIAQYLLRKFKKESQLIPTDIKEQALYDQVIYSTLGHKDQVIIEALVEKLTVPEEKWNTALLEKNKAYFDKNILPTILSELKGHDYAVGNKFTFADIILGFTARIALAMKWTDDATVKSYVDRLSQRAAFKATFSS
ncbi:hypothetical protein HDU76_011689 [Blyttiomyces sp. JEL0837]|nr:hypothetical protein HDU76_011689 [Blyttiomyces sp. JEL0837]